MKSHKKFNSENYLKLYKAVFGNAVQPAFPKNLKIFFF